MVTFEYARLCVRLGVCVCVCVCVCVRVSEGVLPVFGVVVVLYRQSQFVCVGE